MRATTFGGLRGALWSAAIVGNELVTEASALTNIENAVADSMDPQIRYCRSSTTATAELRARNNCDGLENVCAGAGK